MDALATTPLLDSPLDQAPEIIAAQANSRDSRAIDQVATGFESMFLSLLIKQMRQTLEPGTLFGSDQSDIQGGLFDLYLGQHLARSGGLGLGTMLKHYLKSAKQQ
jgi:flagellar protein FlgJ